MNRQAPALVALALAVPALLLSACTPPPAPSTDWSIEVSYRDLEPGACLATSFDADVVATDPFDPNAYYFEVVDCSRTHRAQVIGVVDIPPAAEWSGYGTTSGPAVAESDEWLAGVCRAHELLADAYLADQGAGYDLEVSINYSVIGDARLGACLAHSPGFTPMPVVLDLERMVAIADEVELGAPLPDFAAGWYEGSAEVTGPVEWNALDEGACVADYPGPDEDTYLPASCVEPHPAQFLRWVTMPAEWEGAYRSDEEAAAVVDAQCAAWQAAIAGRPDLVSGVVVERSAVSAEYVVAEVLLAQCWARTADGSPLAVDLAPLL